MNVDKLLKRIEELPKGLTVTKVHIETLNKYGEPLTIEFEKSLDELKAIRQITNKGLNLRFWRRKPNHKK
jgi:hypothetical protein